MAELNTAPQMSAGPQVSADSVRDSDSSRTMAIIIYGLFLSTFAGFAIGPLIGLILAYIKRGDARGSIYESHYTNAIEIFWVSLVMFILGVITLWVGIGVLICIGLFVWYVFRTVKGLARAIDARPYR